MNGDGLYTIVGWTKLLQKTSGKVNLAIAKRSSEVEQSEFQILTMTLDTTNLTLAETTEFTMSEAEENLSNRRIDVQDIELSSSSVIL